MRFACVCSHPLQRNQVSCFSHFFGTQYALRSMPFTNDANWPLLSLIFVAISISLSKIVTTALTTSSSAIVSESLSNFSLPHKILLRNPPNPVDFLVYLQLKPVLIAEIKDDTWNASPDTRLKADTQIRSRFDQMLRECPIPCLYALSLLGTSLRVYRGDVANREIRPELVLRPDPNCTLPDDFLEGAWKIDVLSQEGFDKMKEIVSYIFAQSEA